MADPKIISFLTLRKVVGWLGISPAPVLFTDVWFLDCPGQIDISISAYYYLHMRDALIGIISGISLFLISYHRLFAPGFFYKQTGGILYVGRGVCTDGANSGEE